MSRNAKRVVLTLILLVILVSCAPTKTEPIKIGAELTLTGFGAQTGDNARKGIDLAVEKINKENGINGQLLEVIYEDLGNLDLKAAATAAQKFSTIDKTKAILTQWSEDTEVVWPIAAENKIITMAIYAGTKDLTKKSPLLFRVWPSDEIFIEKIVDYALSKGAKKAAIISEELTYFSSLKDNTEAIWEKRTGSKPFTQTVAVGTIDLRTPLMKIKEQNPDVLFVQVNVLQ